MNIHDLASMGGYGVYVWSAYAITLSVFAFNVIYIFQEKRQIKKLIKQYIARQT